MCFGESVTEFGSGLVGSKTEVNPATQMQKLTNFQVKLRVQKIILASNSYFSSVGFW